MFILFVCILCPIPTHGLGVTPSRVTWDFEPNKVYEGYACFLISSIARLRFEIAGTFNNSLVINSLDENNEIIIDDKNNCVTYKLKLPATANPGPQRTNLNALEIPDETSGSIFAVVKIQHQIDVIVPYPGKYLTIDEFSIPNGAAGDSMPITVSITSKGTEIINEAQGTVVIYDKDNSIIGRMLTSSAKNIRPQETRILKASWDSGTYKSGNYHATLRLAYDGNYANASTAFKLGGLEVNMIDYSSEIIIGGIREFSVTVDSIWSEIIKNAKAIVTVYNTSDDSSQIISLETLTRQLPPWGTETLTGYLDTSKLSVRNYTIKIDFSYDGEAKEYWRNLSIINEPKPAKEAKKGLALNLTTIMLIALGIMLIIVIIVLVLTFIPKKKKEQQGK